MGKHLRFPNRLQTLLYQLQCWKLEQMQMESNKHWSTKVLQNFTHHKHVDLLHNWIFVLRSIRLFLRLYLCVMGQCHHLQDQNALTSLTTIRKLCLNHRYCHWDSGWNHHKLHLLNRYRHLNKSSAQSTLRCAIICILYHHYVLRWGQKSFC